MTLKAIISKNLKIIFRSKTTLILALIIPLITVLLVSIAYDKTQNIPNASVGYYSDAYSQTSYNIISQIQNQGINIMKFSSKDLCKNAIKNSYVSACIFFPSDLSYTNLDNNINIIVDYSKMNLAWQIQNIILYGIGKASTNITKDITSNLLSQMATASQTLNSQMTSINKISSKNDLIQSEAISSSSLSKSINTSFSRSAFPMSNLNQTANNQVALISAISTQAKNSQSSINSATDSIVQELDKLNLSSSEMETLKPYFIRINGEINQTVSQISKSYNSSVLNQGQISGEFSSILKELSALQAQFQNIVNKKNAINTNLNSITYSTSAIDSGINSISNAVSTLVNDLSLVSTQSPGKIAQPITTTIKPIISDSNSVNYVFPKMLLIIFMFSALILSSDFIFYDKKNLSYLRNLFSPVTTLSYNFAHFISDFTIIFLELVSILIISVLVIPGFIEPSVFAMFLFLLVYSILFILLGILIGDISNSEENATIISTTVGILLLIFSGIFIPLEYLPKIVSQILSVNPVVIAENSLRQITFFQGSLSSNINNLIISLLYILLESFIIIFTIIITQGLFEKRKVILHRKNLIPVNREKIRSKRQHIKTETKKTEIDEISSELSKSDLETDWEKTVEFSDNAAANPKDKKPKNPPKAKKNPKRKKP